MAHRNSRQLAFIALAALLVAGLVVPPAHALPTSSKTAPDQTLAERAEDMAVLETALDRPEVEDALAAQGLSRDEVNQRLAQLSPEELSSLSTQVDQIQAAGQPTYIWVMIAILIVVAIVAIA
jgi:hypothetical protein